MDDLNSLPLPELFERLVAGSLLDRLLDLVIEEDLGSNGAGDITSATIIEPDRSAAADLVAREPGVIAGIAALPHLLARFDSNARFEPSVVDGDAAAAGTVLGTFEGSLLLILKVERIVLNLLGRMSGVATLARRYVQAVAGMHTAICETRKTTPGLRAIEKYAARCGGATLHRIGLYDAVLYKDNHLAHLPAGEWTQALTQAAKRARARPRPLSSSPSQRFFVEVEVDTLEQLDQVLAIEPGLVDCILLDNMPRDVLRQAVRMRDERASGVVLEASGGINLANVRAIAETGIDRISAGAITHSAPALDVGLDVRGGEPIAPDGSESG